MTVLRQSSVACQQLCSKCERTRPRWRSKVQADDGAERHARDVRPLDPDGAEQSRHLIGVASVEYGPAGLSLSP